MKNILIIAPHADDEVLGCGGAINFYKRKGYKIYVAILTNANKGDKIKFSENYITNVRKESIKAHKYLGIKETFFYEFPAPYLDQYPIAKVSDELKKLINKINPHILFIPHLGDAHIDHQIIHKASLIASRPLSPKSIQLILSYETLSETEWGVKKDNLYFIPNYYIELSSNDIKKKISAFNFYKSQIKKNNHPRSINSIKSLAKYRGSNISRNFAEAFLLIRNIEK